MIITILIVIIFYLLYKNFTIERTANLKGYYQGTKDMADSLTEHLIQATEQLERDKKIKDEKLKTNITNTSNSADESADSSGL